MNFTSQAESGNPDQRYQYSNFYGHCSAWSNMRTATESSYINVNTYYLRKRYRSNMSTTRGGSYL